MRADQKNTDTGASGADAASAERSAAPAVKICGLTCEEDAIAVNASGASYAGFVFHAPSRRNIDYDTAKRIMEVLDPSIRRVAVVVSPTPERVREIQALAFDIIQIHGSCPPETLREIRLPIWRAVNIANMDEFTVSAQEEGMDRVSGILIDAKEYGSGKTFDWNAAAQIRAAARKVCAAVSCARSGVQAASCVRNGISGDGSARNASQENGEEVLFILAGGLSAGNIAEGIRLFAPDVVDVSSGVEYDAAPDGVRRAGKDPKKVLAFAAAVGSRRGSTTKD